MYINDKLTAEIRKAAAAINEERHVAQETDGTAFADSVAAVIATIPRIIAEKQLAGATCAEVLTLVQDRDYILRSWTERKFDKAPKVENLSLKAAEVFAYCARAGLKPHLSRFFGSDYKQSAIIIEWVLPETMVKDMMGDLTAGAFVADLREKTAAAKAKQALERSIERTAKARSAIAEVSKRTQDAAREAQNTAIICSFEGHQKDPDLNTMDHWVADVAKYCRALGLQVHLTSDKIASSGCDLQLDYYRCHLWATWPAATE